MSSANEGRGRIWLLAVCLFLVSGCTDAPLNAPGSTVLRTLSGGSALSLPPLSIDADTLHVVPYHAVGYHVVPYHARSL